MAGLVPAIHASQPRNDKVSECIVSISSAQRRPGVDARDKPGHAAD